MSMATNCGERNGNYKHGRTDTPTFNSWMSMRRRCLDSTHHNYQRYGGRGISICERWEKFENFFADMGPRPVGKTLDRFPNNKGNYEPNNCRWATPNEQVLNREYTRLVEFDGITMTIPQWSEKVGICYPVLFRRIVAGWEIKDALTIPIAIKRKTILTDDEIAEMRALRESGLSWPALGKRFGIGRNPARNACLGITGKRYG